MVKMEKLVTAAPSIQLPSARSAQQSYNLEPRTPARRIPVQEYPKLAHHVTKIQAALQLMSRGPFAGRKVKFPELLYFNPPYVHPLTQHNSAVLTAQHVRQTTPEKVITSPALQKAQGDAHRRGDHLRQQREARIPDRIPQEEGSEAKTCTGGGCQEGERGEDRVPQTGESWFSPKWNMARGLALTRDVNHTVA